MKLIVTILITSLVYLQVTCMIELTAEEKFLQEKENKIFMKIRPMENMDFREGDIATGTGSDLSSRTAAVSPDRLWPGGVVPYYIDETANSNKSLIEKVFNYFHENTCIRFVPRLREHKDYIVITRGKGCSSIVGMDGGLQPVNLGSGCMSTGIIMHELGHVIGFYHEHNRPDRDDYITIIQENVKPKAMSQFRKYPPNSVNMMTKYSYDTIMHYGSRTFSKDGVLVTMVPKQPGVVLKETYQKEALTEEDIKYINILYGCK